MYLSNISNIHNVRIRYGFDLNPLSISLPFHFQSSDVVLGEHCQDAGVFVSANTERQLRRWAWRIVIQPHKTCLLFEIILKPFRWQSQATSNQFHQFVAKFLQFFDIFVASLPTQSRNKFNYKLYQFDSILDVCASINIQSKSFSILCLISLVKLTLFNFNNDKL